MRFVSTIIMKKSNRAALAILLLTATAAKAQENSPYSRYGIGNLVPSQNVVNRAMGGVNAAYFDRQSINTMNPASYSKMEITTFDIGLDFENRVLRSPNNTDKFKATNMLVNYINIGLPLKRGKWGMNIGLKPVSRINYKIEKRERLPGIDSMLTIYQGTGGAYKAMVGTGYGWKNLSIGINTGYFFGKKEIQTRTIPINDSVLYSKSLVETADNFGKMFLDAGVQYGIKLSKTKWLRLGAYGNLEQKLNAKRNLSKSTFNYTGDGADQIIDSVFTQSDVKGTIVYPASYGVGLMFEKTDKFMIGVDYEASKWSNYRAFDKSDLVQDNWTLRVGGQVLPNLISTNYWARVSYRAGFYTGTDYIKPEAKGLNQYGVTFGAGFPVRRSPYSYQFTVINTGIEVGRRGGNENGIKENFVRLSLGLTLSDLWFVKKKYE